MLPSLPPLASRPSASTATDQTPVQSLLCERTTGSPVPSLAEIHQCSRFPGPLARQTRGADRYQHLLYHTLCARPGLLNAPVADWDTPTLASARLRTAGISITIMPVAGSRACTRRRAVNWRLDKARERYCNFQMARSSLCRTVLAAT